MSSEETKIGAATAQEALQKSINYLAMNFGAADSASEFSLIDFIKDELGMSHFRLQQVYKGLRVFGQHLIVHIAKDGEVRDATGEYRKDVVGMNIEPKIAEGEAIETARKDFGTEASKEFSAELLIYPERESAKNRLAYLVTMPLWQEGVPMRLRYFIDAKTGEILEQYNDRPVTGEATRGIADRFQKK